MTANLGRRVRGLLACLLTGALLAVAAGCERSASALGESSGTGTTGGAEAGDTESPDGDTAPDASPPESPEDEGEISDPTTIEPDDDTVTSAPPPSSDPGGDLAPGDEPEIVNPPPPELEEPEPVPPALAEPPPAPTPVDDGREGIERVDYDIVYVRAPRYGDTQRTLWPEVFHPINMEPGADLVLLHPDGSEEVLVRAGDGAVLDPYVSFDGQAVYFAMCPNVLDQNYQRADTPRAGTDIYKMHLPTRQVVRLTFQEWTPNTGAGNWSSNHLAPEPSGTNYLGYGIFNLGPCPLPGGRVIFSSSRNGFLPNKNYSFPNLQLYVMDDDGENVELVGHLSLGSALHPTVLVDGRVMFASYEAQGIRDRRMWGLWSIYPDGRNWGPLMSAFELAAAFHFQTQLSDGRIVFEEYYNKNNNGFGTFLAIPPGPPDASRPPFGSPDPRGEGNPVVPFAIRPADRYPFSPQGIEGLTLFAHGKDLAAAQVDGEWAGKVTHPSGAPNNDLLLVWTPGPANDLNRPVNLPVYDGGIYLLPRGIPADSHKDLVLIKNDPRYNEQQPRAVVPYRRIYGVDEPATLPWLPNDGSESPELPAGTPFGLVGTSSFYKRNTAPGSGLPQYDGLDPFNTTSNYASSNWSTQGADAGKYSDSEIYAVRVLSLEPSSHRSYGPHEHRNHGNYSFYNFASERMRILGEIPLKKRDSSGNLVMDVDGNPDTSFLAKIPADVPFTFQTIDENGLVLNMSQTWHQVRPGEKRVDCGGCHAHAQMGTAFESTAASRGGYVVKDLVKTTPVLTKDANGKTVVRSVAGGAVDVEYFRDIKPILKRSCVPCHSKSGRAERGLVLDDEEPRNGFEGTYWRLCMDSEGEFGIKPLIGSWRSHNASRYIRKLQSRRSLLVWKVFGRRLDGWTNEEHPTEAVPGDPTTFPAGAAVRDADIDFTGTMMPPPGSGVPPLSADEKMTIARWIDLGCPVDKDPEYGWFLDDLRPTLTVSVPAAGLNEGPLAMLRVGAADYYSGLVRESLSVTANFAVNGKAPGAELAGSLVETADHVWTLYLDSPITVLDGGKVTVSVRDRQGNVTRVVRSFSVEAPPAQ